MLRHLIAAAERRELEVEHAESDDFDRQHHIWQVWIGNPRRTLDTRLLVTCSRGTPTVTVCHLTKSEKVSWRRAFAWLEIIAI